VAGSRPVGAHLRARWRTPLLIVPTLVVLMLAMNLFLAAGALLAGGEGMVIARSVGTGGLFMPVFIAVDLAAACLVRVYGRRRRP
jgi:hypothetical protein